MLTMLLLFVGNNVWAESWVKTSPIDLLTGDVVAIVDLNKSVVMPNSNGSSSAPAATAITLNSDQTEIDDEVVEAWQWVVIVGGEDVATYQFGVEGKDTYLYCTATNNGVRVGTNTNNEFIIKDDFLYNVATGRYIGPYNTQDWRCYTSINNNIKDTKIAFFKKDNGGSGVTVAKPVISPNGGTFVYGETQEVTITSEGNTIYYTLDGTEPTDNSERYYSHIPLVIGESCTLKAIAYDDDDNASSVATAVFNFLVPLTTIAEVCDAATDTEQTVFIDFNASDWICTGVKGSNAYFTDNKNGIQVYQSGHGFAVGDELSGYAQVRLKLYNECAEIMGLTATTEGVTVAQGAGATPVPVVVGDLEKNMQGCLITLEGVNYSGGVFIDEDDNTITPYGSFITLPELLEGKIYNVTGVAIWFVKGGNGYWEIAPRSADEIQLVTSKVAPESFWSVESEVVDINDMPTAVFTTNSDGVVTYESSNEDVATVDENGVITPVGRGITTITAVVAESDTYLPDSKSFTLTVSEEGYADAIFAFDDADIVGQGAPNTGAELNANRNNVVSLYANKAYAKLNDTHIKIYGSKFEKEGEGEDATTVMTEPSYIKLSVADGYAIVNVVLTAVSETAIKSWADQSGNEVEISGAEAKWSGMLNEVVLTNQATSQAQLKSITVTYINADVIDAISTPAAVQETTAIYNLAGQRLNKMQKGINIIGGKKVMK